MITTHPLNTLFKAPVSGYLNAVFALLADPVEGPKVATLLPHLVNGQFDLLISRYPAVFARSQSSPSLSNLQSIAPGHYEALRYAAYLQSSRGSQFSPSEFLRLWPTLRPDQLDRMAMLPGFDGRSLSTLVWAQDVRYPVSQKETPDWLVHEWRELPYPNVNNLDADSRATPYDWGARDFRHIVRSMRLHYAAPHDGYLADCVDRALADRHALTLTGRQVQILLAEMENDANGYLVGMGVGSELFWYLAWSGSAYFDRMFRLICEYAAVAAVYNAPSPLRLVYGFGDFIYPAVFDHACDFIQVRDRRHDLASRAHATDCA